MRVETGTDFSFNIPPPSTGESESHATVLKQTLAQYTASVSAAEMRAAKLRDLIKGRGANVPAELAQLREHRRTQHASLFGLGELPAREVDPVRLKQARGEAVAKMRAMAGASGIDVRALRAGVDNVSKQLKSSVTPAPEQGNLRVLSEKARKAVNLGEMSSWAVRTPPYDGWEWWWNYATAGFYKPDYANYINHQTGSVGNRSEWYIFDADDWNYGELAGYSMAGFWLKPTKPGQLQLWLKARCGKASYLLDGYDEVGWSEYWQDHQNHWTVSVSSGTDLDLHYDWGTYFSGPEEEHDYDSADNYPPNNVRWLLFTTSEALAANTWYYLRFGTHVWHRAFSNDETLYLYAKNRWYIEQVEWKTVGT